MYRDISVGAVCDLSTVAVSRGERMISNHLTARFHQEPALPKPQLDKDPAIDKPVGHPIQLAREADMAIPADLPGFLMDEKHLQFVQGGFPGTGPVDIRRAGVAPQGFRDMALGGVFLKPGREGAVDVPQVAQLKREGPVNHTRVRRLMGKLER